MVVLCVYLHICKIIVRIECLCPSKIQVEILTPKVVVLGGGAFGRRFGHEGGALVKGISVPLQNRCESLLPGSLLSGMKGQKMVSMIQGGGPPWHQICRHLDLGLPALQNCEK